MGTKCEYSQYFRSKAFKSVFNWNNFITVNYNGTQHNILQVITSKIDPVNSQQSIYGVWFKYLIYFICFQPWYKAF